MQPASPREKGLKVDPITLVVANQQPKLEKSEEFVDQGWIWETKDKSQDNQR